MDAGDDQRGGAAHTAVERVMDKWKHVMFIAYNDEQKPDWVLPMKDCFHVELNVKDFRGTYNEWLEKYIKPAWTVIYDRMQ